MNKLCLLLQYPLLLTIFCLQIPVSAQEVNLIKGLQVYAPLDTSCENKSVNRLAKAHFQGTHISYNRGVDGFGGAAFFNGKAYARMEHNPKSKYVTFSFWFNTNAMQRENVLLACDKKGYGASISLGGKLNVYLHLVGQQLYTYEHPTNLADGKWHHVAATFDGSRFAVYIDAIEGKAVHEEQGFGADKQIRYEASGLSLGALPKESEPKFYTGLIDEILIYNRALSKDEVKIIANKGRIKQEETLENPILYLPFEQRHANVSPNLLEETEVHAEGGSFANNNCNNGGEQFMKNLDGQGFISGGTSFELPKFTLSFWMSSYTADESFVAGWDTTGYRLILNPKGKPGKLRAQVWVSKSEMLTLNAPETVNDGTCHFIVLSFDGQGAKLYVDGNLREEKRADAGKAMTGGANIWHAASTFLIGRERGQNPKMQFLGMVDEVRLYNRALSTEEVKILKSLVTTIQPSYKIYETAGAGSIYLSAFNPTNQEMTFILKNAAGDKIFQDKVKPGSLPPKELAIKADWKTCKGEWKR